MRVLHIERRRALPVWFRVAVWVAVLLSPTGYFLSLMVLERLQMPAPPEGLAVFLFCVIPVVALVVCLGVVWRANLRVRWRVGWLVLTVVAMAAQVAVLVVIVVIALTAAIALP